LSPQEFYSYSFEDYKIKVDATRKVNTESYRDNWEKVRELSHIIALYSGNLKKGATKYHIMSFPWDDKNARSRLAKLNSEERKAAAKAMAANVNVAFQNYLNSKN
jgi:hypothetical protein